MNVLIVEDEILLAMDIEAIVEDNGHRVLAEVASLKDVEALPDDIDPQLALVDIHLANGSNGLDVCQVIQRRWPEALIVFVTANVAKIPEDFLGAHGVIAKPFSHAGVANAIRYLANGVFNPPPSVPRPASLVPSPHLERRWALA
ncbi:response regulator receiver domain-containing protein [Novosphingobium sp. PhB55]|uniref:response regulator n=1 Tax=Novosphingobium sp. PhB55 TaxID=2485106 RepID=UPI0010EC27E6|nr:response regulator [Novosphingobium sp. PhB55]TDW61531.1 response regulator receiver domain-containing protein [Novosphingobium sp. PhB55]